MNLNLTTMPSVSIIFRNDKLNSKSLAPIHLRIIKDRKTNYISTGIMLPEKFWDEKNKKVKAGFPNSNRLNSFISNKFTELQDQVFEHETLSKSLTTRQLKNKIYGNKPSDFFRFADQACELYLQADKIGTHDKNKSVINKVRDFWKSGELMFQDITVDWLNKYENFCRKEYGNKTNTIHKDFKFIRKLFNDAYRQDIIEHDQIPFLKFQMKTEKTQRTFLTEAELKSMEDLKPVSGSRMEL
ncbi:MAG: phage integrase SAM-like domain and Arm DNA-binding domain-containing protein, partial [Chitinophagales bacterium]